MGLDRFDVERDHRCRGQAFERRRERELIADEFDGVVKHPDYLL